MPESMSTKAPNPACGAMSSSTLPRNFRSPLLSPRKRCCEEKRKGLLFRYASGYVYVYVYVYVIKQRFNAKTKECRQR